MFEWNEILPFGGRTLLITNIVGIMSEFQADLVEYHLCKLSGVSFFAFSGFIWRGFLFWEDYLCLLWVTRQTLLNIGILYRFLLPVFLYGPLEMD